jgi:hypothetical protein
VIFCGGVTETRSPLAPFFCDPKCSPEGLTTTVPAAKDAVTPIVTASANASEIVPTGFISARLWRAVYCNNRSSVRIRGTSCLGQAAA